MVNRRLSAGAIVVFLSLLCLMPGNAFAIPETFNISFDEGGGIVWTGTYTVDGGVLTEFSAEIGNCGANCTYNTIIFNGDPGDSLSLIGSPTGFLTLFANNWSALDLEGSRIGTYNSNSVAVPEPSALLLLGAGLLVVAYVARRRA